jgi:hypothetical protein
MKIAGAVTGMVVAVTGAVEGGRSVLPVTATVTAATDRALPPDPAQHKAARHKAMIDGTV